MFHVYLYYVYVLYVCVPTNLPHKNTYFHVLVPLSLFYPTSREIWQGESQNFSSREEV